MLKTNNLKFEMSTIKQSMVDFNLLVIGELKFSIK